MAYRCAAPGNENEVFPRQYRQDFHNAQTAYALCGSVRAARGRGYLAVQVRKPGVVAVSQIRFQGVKAGKGAFLPHAALYV